MLVGHFNREISPTKFNRPLLSDMMIYSNDDPTSLLTWIITFYDGNVALLSQPLVKSVCPSVEAQLELPSGIDFPNDCNEFDPPKY